MKNKIIKQDRMSEKVSDASKSDAEAKKEELKEEPKPEPVKEEVKEEPKPEPVKEEPKPEPKEEPKPEPVKEEVKEEPKEEIIEIDTVEKTETLENDDEEEEEDQDSKQRMNVMITLLLEFYRVIMGSLLVLFVPQKCDNGESCSIGDNLTKATNDNLVMTGFAFNIVSLICFMTMYFYESKRELRIISYLEVNPNRARDNDSVGEALEHISPDRRDKLLKLDHHYCMSGYGAICAFAVNSIVSGLVVFNNMLDGKTGTVFLTNVLFMGSKLGNMYSIISTEKNIFYSAYLMRKVQYNDVDPDKYIEKVEEV